MRDKAVESLRAVAEQLSGKQIEEYFLPMIKRLALGNSDMYVYTYMYSVLLSLLPLLIYNLFSLCPFLQMYLTFLPPSLPPSLPPPPPPHPLSFSLPGEWFTSRTSACGLFAAAYKLSSTAIKEELRTLVIHSPSLTDIIHTVHTCTVHVNISQSMLYTCLVHTLLKCVKLNKYMQN